MSSLVRRAALVAFLLGLAACTDGGTDAAPVPSVSPSPSPSPSSSSSPNLCPRPEVLGPVSQQNIRYLARLDYVFKPLASTPKQRVVSPAVALGPAPQDCGGRRVVSWQLSLGRVTTRGYCHGHYRPGCKELYDDRLAYIEVRRTFGLGSPAFCCPGNPQPTQENVYLRTVTIIDAKTGERLRTVMG